MLSHIFIEDDFQKQFIGLDIGGPYNIQAQVTDSQDQTDIAGSTLTILPLPVIDVSIDIKPHCCPNPVSVNSKGVLSVAILGTEEFDVIEIDPVSVRLAGVEPIRSSYRDVSTPVINPVDCECTKEGPDGYDDLVLKFEIPEILQFLGYVNAGDKIELTLTGVLSDETPIEGSDCIIVCGKPQTFRKEM